MDRIKPGTTKKAEPFGPASCCSARGSVRGSRLRRSARLPNFPIRRLLPCALLGNLLLDAVDIKFFNVAQQILPHRMETESAFDHFVDGLCFRPAFAGDPIDCHHCACTVRSVPTMHKDRLHDRCGYNAQKLHDIFILRMPNLERNLFKSQFRVLWHKGRIVVESPKRNNRPDREIIV